jgi:zinc transport system substrate-binding protein
LKKLLSVFTALSLTAGCITACSTNNAPAADSKNLQIVTTIFPEYDWVMNILGDNPANAEVTMLLDNGADLHSYQPTASDILKISTCDVFVYVGGESDEWVDDVLKEATNKDMVVINLMDELGNAVKEEEIIEGMEGHDHEHEHEHDEDHDHDHDEHDEDHDDEDHEHDHEHHHEEGEVEYDEHVWLSLKNASVLVGAISEAIAKADSANAATYRANASAYIDKLNALDKEYSDMVSAAARDVLVFGDRFPFRYMIDDYGLVYYAAFVGCSAESEASFETIMFLAGKVDENSLTSVITIEGKEHKIAETIISNTATKDQKILTLDSMQTTTMADIKNGTTYISVMESNYEVLKDALN